MNENTASSRSSASIMVSSPVRFALVGPGKNYPELMMSNSDEVADLVGLYSMRELGIDSFFNTPFQKRLPMPAFLADVLGFSFRESDDGPSALEVEIADPEDRSIVVSLISEERYLDFIRPSERASLEQLVRDIYKSIKGSDISRAKYLGEALSSVFSQLRRRAQEYTSKRKMRVIAYRFILFLVMTVYLLWFYYIFISRSN